MSRTTLKAAHRRDWIAATLREFGPLTAMEISDRWRVHCGRGGGINAHVTIDTIQRDLTQLLRKKLIEKRRSATKGHEMGSGSWVAYAEYQIPIHLRPGYCGICGYCHNPKEPWPHASLGISTDA